MTRGFYSIVKDPIQESARVALIEGVIQSEYFGESVLGNEFVKTNGFSLVFRREGMGLLFDKFSYLRPLLQCILFESCNAFYVNPLVLHDGSRVDAHIDCRLITPGDIRIIPNLVSVYYADVAPDMVGGALILNSSEDSNVRIAPSNGSLVHFLGSTIHRVEAVSSGGRRVSVVCEQYHLDELHLCNFPVCEVLASGSNRMRVNALHPELGVAISDG